MTGVLLALLIGGTTWPIRMLCVSHMQRRRKDGQHWGLLQRGFEMIICKQTSVPVIRGYVCLWIHVCAVSAGAGSYDTAVAAPECAAAVGGLHAARSGRSGHAILSQVACHIQIHAYADHACGHAVEATFLEAEVRCWDWKS